MGTRLTRDDVHVSHRHDVAQTSVVYLSPWQQTKPVAETCYPPSAKFSSSTSRAKFYLKLVSKVEEIIVPYVLQTLLFACPVTSPNDAVSGNA